MKVTRRRFSSVVTVLTLLVGVVVGSCRAGEQPAPPAPQEPEREPETEFPVSASEQANAAELLEAARRAYEARRLEEAREGAERVVERYPRTSAALPAVWIAARAAFELGDYDAAARYAEHYAANSPADAPAAREAAALAERARTMTEPGRRTRRAGGSVARIGVVLPLSGSRILQQYGELVLQGIRIAEETYASRGGPRVEFVVRDDRGQVRRSAEIVADLEREGVVGVIGPLVDPAVRAAADARRDPSLVIVSPTAMAEVDRMPNVYSMNQDDARGAEATAEYLLRAGFRRVGAIFPRHDPYAAKAMAFMRAMWRGGGVTVGAMPYDSGTTTFKDPLQAFAHTRPQAIYIPAPQRDVELIAPQVAYYGLDTLGVWIAGDRAWASPEVRRRVEPSYLHGVIASTPLPEGSGEVGWDEFVERYGRAQRRTLDNRFPALGHDAAVLLLEALPGRWNSPFEVSRRFGGLRDVRGATGVISVRDRRITRRPFMVRVERGIDGSDAIPALRPDTIVPPPIYLPTDTMAADSTPG